MADVGWRALLVAGAVLLGACSDDDSEPDADVGSIPEAAVDPRALSPPGTPLIDGLVVADGSELIGRPGPFGTLLYIAGDPVEVVDAYVAQAHALGYRELVPDRLGRRTSEGPQGRNTISRCGLIGPFEEEADADEASGFACSVTMTNDADRCLSLEVLRGVGQFGQANHASLTSFHTRFPNESCYSTYVDADPDGEPIAAPDQWPDLPSEGESLTDWYFADSITVQPGSRVVAAPAYVGLGLGFCGPLAVLEVTAPDPTTVGQAYTDLFLPGRVLPDSLRHEQTVFGGSTVTSWSFPSLAGGDSFDTWLVETPQQPTWLVLRTCQG